jgi:hypothetical protein
MKVQEHLMGLFRRKRPWQDDWAIEIFEAEHKSRPGVTAAWGWNIVETKWEAIAETTRIMIALGDPEQRDRYEAHLNDPEARFVYRSRYAGLDDAGSNALWYPTERDARDAATAAADMLWKESQRIGPRRKEAR